MKTANRLLSLVLIILTILPGCSREAALQKGESPRSQERLTLPKPSSPPPLSLIFELRTHVWASCPNPDYSQETITELRVRPGETIGPAHPWGDTPPFTLLEILDEHHAKVRIAPSLEYHEHSDYPRYRDQWSYGHDLPPLKRSSAAPVVVSLEKLRAYTTTCDAGEDYWLRLLDVGELFVVRPDNPEIVASITGCARVVRDATGSIVEVVGHSDFSDQDLAKLAKLSSLRRLCLADTAVTDAGMVCMKEIPRLLKLDLGGTRIGSGGALQLGDLRRLEILNLSKTNVGDETVKILLAMKNLERLDISTRRFSRNALCELRQGLPYCLVKYYSD